MRLFPNNRGAPPRPLSTTRHLWIADQANAAAAVNDLCGYGGNPLNLTAVSSPAVCNGWGAAGGRVLDGVADCFEVADGTVYSSALFLKFDDNAATAVVLDSSGNARHGALTVGNSADYHLAGAKNVDGFTGLPNSGIAATNFNGWYVDGNKLFTAVWLRAAAMSGGYNVWTQFVSGSQTSYMTTTSDFGGSVSFRINETNAISMALAWDANWHLVCYGYDVDANKQKIFIDNVASEEGMAVQGAILHEVGHDFCLGNGVVGGPSWPYDIDNMHAFTTIPYASWADAASILWNGGAGINRAYL